jgi:NADH-quinone oxidoreductase subunit N
MTGREEISAFRGLADGQPFLAATIAIGLFSLGGLPIFAGFTIKFYLFTALASQGLLWLAALAIFSSLISLYYYLQVIRQMYIRPVEEVAEAVAGWEVYVPTGPSVSTSPLILIVQSVTLVGVFWVGVYPAPFLAVIDAASHAILPGL